jgi:hypothetical protein
VIGRKQSIWLSAPSEEIKKEWLSELKGVLSSLNERVRKVEASSTKVAKAKANQAIALLGQKYATLRKNNIKIFS